MPCASSHLGRGLLRVLDCLGHERRCSAVAVLERSACQFHRDDRVDAALLRSVVQVAYDAPALLVGRRHDPCARSGEVRSRDDDRGAGRRADPGFLHEVGDRPVDVGEVVAPRGTAGLPDACDDDRVVERPAAADLEQMRRLAPRADHRARPIGLVAPNSDQRNAQHLRHLPGDRGEHLRRRRPAGHPRRDSPQGRLPRREDRLVLAAQLLGV
jgi:hypothetical protein